MNALSLSLFVTISTIAAEFYDFTIFIQSALKLFQMQVKFLSNMMMLFHAVCRKCDLVAKNPSLANFSSASTKLIVYLILAVHQ